jgi:hypothetical protein
MQKAQRMLTEFHASVLSSLMLKEITMHSVAALSNKKFITLKTDFLFNLNIKRTCLNICGRLSVAAINSKKGRGLKIWQ